MQTVLLKDSSRHLADLNYGFRRLAQDQQPAEIWRDRRSKRI